MLKTGDKVRCINSDAHGLSHNKIYTIISSDGSLVKIIDDYGHEDKFKYWRFELVQDKQTASISIDEAIRNSTKEYNDGMMCSKSSFEEDISKTETTTFEPSKTFLMEHKDEYVIEHRNGDINKFNYILDYEDDLTFKRYDGDNRYDIVAIYKKL